ncbi:MAG TPA: VapC toxin family PIN domain ribonuclease [Elusimicrobia bacterium]|jgi:PIN domain nuclease of toxin-antitoxin system|nr:VapC toxin family PIN domain ribonuclease [Elusimicrobiota bacterium]
MYYVTDTHPLVWHITESQKLSKSASAIFDSADKEIDHIVIPCIVLLEILYLTEKKKIPEFFLENLIEKLSRARNYSLEPLCVPIVSQCKNISRDRISDPSDRVIAATALHLNFPLITRDESLKKIGLEVVW